MSKRKKPRDQPNSWQQELLGQLTALAAGHRQDLRVTGRPRTGPDNLVTVPISIRTADIPQVQGGLPVKEVEDFDLILPPTPAAPPWVQTRHTRFAGTPHVLEGNRLCIYLDPTREWDPRAGIASVVNRLWEWITDATANKFDPTTALYHPVGGVLHYTAGAPTVVAREALPYHTPSTGWLTPRSPHRLDLTTGPVNADSHRAPILPVDHSLPLGAGSTLAELMTLIDSTDLDIPKVVPQSGALSQALLTALAASCVRAPEGTAQYFILAVRHPAIPASAPFLLAGRLKPPFSDMLRLLTRRRAPGRLGRLSDELLQATIEWCYLSDERPEITIRRDTQRPVHIFQGTHIHIWGCGGIGSWAAELVTRAGAARITLSDPGLITGGLLVRQNYTENHIGTSKAVALAQRLRTIRDDVTIEIASPPPDSALIEAADHADLIIDATVSMPAGRFLDLLAQRPHRKAVLAQMATDSLSASLGILTVAAPGTPASLSTIDHISGQRVLATSSLEPYHQLWAEPAPGDELLPTRGCSVPTFHGSAADLMATTATLVNLLGIQMRHPQSGTHLCAQPHTGVLPAHHFITHTAPDQ